MLRCLLALAFATALFAQRTMPVPIYKPEPAYTEEARRWHVSTSVGLALLIDAQGNVAEAYVTRPAGLGLDELAVNTVKTWKFKPGTRDGSPVAVFANVETNYRLLTGGSDTLWIRRVVVDSGPPRKLASAKPVAVPPRIRPGEVTALAEVDESGQVLSAKIVRSLDPAVDNDVADALRKWKFHKGSRQTVKITLGTFAMPDQEAVKASFQNAEESMRRARELFTQGKLDDALATTEETLRGRDSYTPALQMKSRILSQQGKNEEALLAMTAVIELTPFSAGDYERRALLYDKLGRKDEAAADRARAAQLKEILPLHTSPGNAVPQ